MFFWAEGNQFHIVHCLKSFDLILFFVYTLKLLMGPLWQICPYIFFLYGKTYDFLEFMWL